MMTDMLRQMGRGHYYKGIGKPYRYGLPVPFFIKE